MSRCTKAEAALLMLSLPEEADLRIRSMVHVPGQFTSGIRNGEPAAPIAKAEPSGDPDWLEQWGLARPQARPLSSQISRLSVSLRTGQGQAGDG
jgi:hypothetical protein